jgi:hypothetical protein
MSEVLDLSDAVRVLCGLAGLEPKSVRDIFIHGQYISFELVDGSVVAFLREDQSGQAA